MDDEFFFPFGPFADPGPEHLPPHVRRIGRQLYRQGWKQYHEAGCPFGVQDEAMMIWYSFNGCNQKPSLTVGRN